MFLKEIAQRHGHPDTGTFNLTPVIDIVFLLILFFLVVCQFIEAENFPVNVPDLCEFAQNDTEEKSNVTTLTVVNSSDNKPVFAVDAEQIKTSNTDLLITNMVDLLNKKLKSLPGEQRTVTLRIDKDVCFDHAQYALAGIAQSIATDIKLSALKEKSSNE